MAAPGADGFDVWLTDKLKSLSCDIDTDVFVTYIIGILDTDSLEDENEENITELLSGVVDPDSAESASRSIVSQWNVHLDSKKGSQVTEDVADKLSMIFEQQALATVKEKKLSKEQADRKAAILAQYGQVSDGEETDPEELSADEISTPAIAAAGTGAAAKVKGETSDPLLMRNVNKEEVTRLEREKRDKAKEEQEKKKEKDKQDRLAQKQKQQERKETEKKRTQKGEKRR
ncbi:unnamed protein product [Candidula unifasciata]|uniref:Coiled-coil domain-containing protein 43 n=1 Tax=Candidula unifasciata TaxID=100452 RepID=A0A8S3ZLK9_9EUPU|nr:unnamed protein product [Candidula unifasciata]